MLNIKTGIIPRAQRVVIYGPEGIGKTTLAAQFPEPLFIDTEGGTAHMDVSRIDSIKGWDELITTINEVAATEGVCKTLVIDTADWAEQLAIGFICSKYKKNGIEEFGYSKGYVYLAEEFGRFLAALDKVIAAGIHVVVTAHAAMRKFEQPDEMGAYDRWETKLTKKVAPLLKEWCDMLLFCNYRTYVIQSDNAMEKAKATGGKRVIYTAHHPCWDAKNRHGLPEMVDMDYKAIAGVFVDEPLTAPKPIDEVRKLMEEANVTEEQLMKVVSDKGHYPADTPISSYEDKFLKGWVIKYWPQVLQLINKSNEGGLNNE